MPERVTIGVDVGGTKTLVMAVPIGGVDSWRTDGGPASPTVCARFATPDDSAHLVDELVDAVEAARGRFDIVGVGLGLAGLIALDGRVVTAPNTRFLEGTTIGPELAERLGIPVSVDNDANVAAWATREIDAPAADHAVVVAIGTGIGGGFVVDGTVLRGHNGFAAEPGHMIVEPGGRRCRCGQLGCWEQYGSGTALGDQANEAVASGRWEGDHPDGTLRGEDVTRLAAAGNPGAIAVLDDFADWVSVGVVNLVALFDPEIVVLCGGLIADAERVVARVQRRVVAMPIGAGREVRVRAAVTGPETSAVGAALLARSQLVGR